MVHKSIFTLFLVFIPFIVCAQEAQMSLVAIKQNGQSQTFKIDDYPRLTISNVNGNPSFSIKDKRNISVNDVRTCLFRPQGTNETEDVISPNGDNQKSKKYVKNGVLYIEHNGNHYNVIGQRIK